MTIVTIDFETRSAVDLKKHGLYRYATDPSTSVMCLAAAVDDADPVIWIPDHPLRLINVRNLQSRIVSKGQMLDTIMDAERVVAHNAAFEHAIWHHVKPDWPKLDIARLYDTMALAAYHALPLALAKAAHALGLSCQKDDAGHKVMLKLCRPRTPRKAEREKDPRWEEKLWWHESAHELEALYNYCCKDVLAERALYRALPDLPLFERRIWEMDHKINLRGVPVDVHSAQLLVGAITQQEQEYLAQFASVTGGAVSSPRAYVGLRAWVAARVDIEEDINISKADVETLLAREDVPPQVRRALEIKVELGKSSVAKFKSMLQRVDADDRVRGTMQYHGASTGRWAARGIQPHNMPRDSYAPDVVEQYLATLRADPVWAEIAFDTVYHAASRCVRGVIKAPPGHQFICADFSAIEGRGLAYLAGENWVLESYQAGRDMYKVVAARCLRKEYDQITKDERQQIGKPGDLACGYGGGVGAVRAFGGGNAWTDDEIFEKIVKPWRDTHPATVSYWYDVERAAFRAIKFPGKLVAVGRTCPVQFAAWRGYLGCRMPSGRVLHYYKPGIEPAETPWGETKDMLHYWGTRVLGASSTTSWGKVVTRGSKLVENIVQGFCRDILAEAMLRLEEAGFPIVMHVHDEIVALLPESEAAARSEEFKQIMACSPGWAADMPITVEGWTGTRYRK